MRNPSVLSVVRIARALGVTTSKLMERVDTENNNSNHTDGVRTAHKQIFSENNRRGGGTGRKTL
jgi:hypothetical protein